MFKGGLFLGRKHIDLIGKRFGRLTVIELVGKDKSYNKLYKCRCECGNFKIVPQDRLVTGKTKSCGCLKKERLTKHGKSRTKLYDVHQQMLARCYNPNSKNYEKYGKYGITVYDEWRDENGFSNFYNWSMLNGYSEGLTIDRINTYGNYEPNNCRWADYETQNTNLKMLKNNKSGYRGCFYLKKYKKWLANISINNKSVHIGTYETLKECVDARNKYIDDNKLPHQKNIWRGEDV